MPKSYDPELKLEFVLCVIKGDKIADLADMNMMSATTPYISGKMNSWMEE